MSKGPDSRGQFKCADPKKVKKKRARRRRKNKDKIRTKEKS